MDKFELAFEWRGFELHPEIPAGGLSVRRMFPPDAVAAMHRRLQRVADDLGVPFHPQDHAPSTKKALALSIHAREQGRLDAWREAAMDAYWRDGKDLEDTETLEALAAGAGLDPAAALAFLDRPDVPARLLEQRRDAQRWGVTGIPTWFMLPAGWTPEDGVPAEGPRPVRVVGCQPAEVVEQAARMAGARPRA